MFGRKLNNRRVVSCVLALAAVALIVFGGRASASAGRAYEVEAASTALSVSLQQGVVVLTWTNLGSTIDHYEVYRSQAPYFGLQDAGVARLPNVAGTADGSTVSTTDLYALSVGETSYYYAVLPVSKGGSQYVASNHAGLTNRALNGAGGSPAVTYYVDSAAGNDGNSCTAAKDSATPKKTVYGVMACNPAAGETVRFRGEFKETIKPTKNGTVLYDVQDIAGVSGSVVTFNQAISGLNPATDYVALYGSRRGNSGAFAVLSVSGQSVTVDTASLPGGKFNTESAADPGSLQGAILRPVVFTAWDRSHPPVFSGPYHTYQSFNKRVILVSYLKSISGVAVNPGQPVWGTIRVDGDSTVNSDFHIFDHLEVMNAECAIATESSEFRSNYDILQYNYLHDIGSPGTGSDEIIYWGFAGRADLHHDFVQIMYNRVGPHAANADLGDGIELKPSAHNATVFGNEITGINAQGCDDAPVNVGGAQAFIANNYLHDISPADYLSCGIAVIDTAPSDPNDGGDGAILANNIVANVRGIGIKVIDTSGVQILNNTVYNIPPESPCDATCMETNMGIGVWNYLGPTQNLVIKNNIVQRAHIGIGRYLWSHDYPVSIDSDYNMVYGADYAFRGTITQNTHDRVVDPALIDPANHNFSPAGGSPARDAGANLSGAIGADNHDAADPTLPDIVEPVIRSSPWDIGAYELK